MAPPTPPEIDGHELQDGFQHLLQHNSRSQSQRGPYALDNGSYVPSGPTTSYNTPEPEVGAWYLDHYGNKRFMYHDQVDLGGEMQYDGYGQPILNPHHGGPYQGHPPPQHHQYPNPAFYSASPPPTISDQSSPPRRAAKQNRLAANTDFRHNSPKPKRKAAKNAKPKTLSGPLSELTKNMDDVPLKDTEAWVNRSMEERQKEAKKDNFVKRPSNSFILYRSAYADRARSFQKSANHQIVSSLAGESWAMEPPEIRKQYDAWAKLERENHAKAFPEYKFQPQTNKEARKRKGRADDSEGESDLESDYAYNPRTSGRPLKSKKAKNAYRESSYTPSGTSLDEYDLNGLEAPGMYHPSSYQMTNPGKPLPAALNQLGRGLYYQTTSHPNQRMANYGYVEDVMIQPTDFPPGFHQPGAPVIGIPGAYHHELQGEDNGQSMLNHLDPMLANYDQDHHRLSLGNGHNSQAQENSTALQAGGFQTGQYSPVLNDFESDHGSAVFGSQDWWEQNKDR